MINGFKKTEIGYIPKDWKIIKLKDISMEFIGGGTPSTSNPEYWDGNIPWMTSTILTKMIINEGMRNITEYGLKNSSTNIVPKGSILIATRVGIGKVGIAGIDIAINQDLTGIVLNSKQVTTEYLYWFLLNHSMRFKALSQGTTIKGLTRSFLKNIKIILPPIFEQQKIAEILSTVDEAIQKVEMAIYKTEKLKRGLMQELLTKGIGHSQFKKTKIGQIPVEWTIVKLGDEKLIKLIMGQSPSSSTYNKNKVGLPFFQGKNEFGYIYPTPSIYCAKPIKIAEEKDILLSVRAPVGDVNIALFKCCIGRGLSAIRVINSELNYLFLFYYLQYFKWRFESISMGSTFKAIRKTEIENFKFPLPTLPEQQKIAEILTSIDRRLELEKERKKRFIKIKIGLMNDLLTGKKRVNIGG
ncbi:MAG: restriction endonuclease subunit S [Candidatus Helarchaeota archaeon]